jgi:hypothetical protein
MRNLVANSFSLGSQENISKLQLNKKLIPQVTNLRERLWVIGRVATLEDSKMISRNLRIENIKR